MTQQNQYELERQFEIWNNKTGEHLRIGPDRDGLELIEIRSVTNDGKIDGSILLDHEQLPLLIQALQSCRKV